MSNNLSIFWSDEREWPVEKPGYVFLARAMKMIGQVLFPTEWTGEEPWADLPPAPLHETPDLSTVRFTDDMRRAFSLIGKSPPPAPPLGRSRPPSPNGRPQMISPPEVTPPPRLTQEEWDAARAASLEVARAGLVAVSHWSDVRDHTWRALITGTLKVYLRNDSSGKLDGPVDPDWWNYEFYSSRFGFCLMEVTNPTKQRHYERGGDIRNPALMGSDFRLIFVSESSLKAVLAGSRLLEVAAAGALTSGAPSPSRSKGKRGAKPGQGKKPDDPHVKRIMQMERGGMARHAATVKVATELSLLDPDRGSTNAVERHRKRLWRKVMNLPQLPPTDTITDTKTNQ